MKLKACTVILALCAFAFAAAAVVPAVAEDAALDRTVLPIPEPTPPIVTELDASACTADQLRVMPVAATLLGGRFTHRVAAIG